MTDERQAGLRERCPACGHHNEDHGCTRTGCECHAGFALAVAQVPTQEERLDVMRLRALEHHRGTGRPRRRRVPRPRRRVEGGGSGSAPTFDGDGYPTDDTLERIREWPVKTNDDFAAVMDFAGSAWSYPDSWECIERWEDPDWPSFPKRVYRFSTGGWSGNESIVSAIEGNDMLQLVGAWSWQRGGHYEYRFPIVTDGVATAALLSTKEEGS